MPQTFDTVVVVDWSASATPSPARPSPNAIWIGVATDAGDTSTYIRTRADAARTLTAFLDTAAEAGRRVLVGFDFPFGYPEGFARRLTGAAGAAAIWHWLDAHLADDAENRNDRFALADRINAAIGLAGPFWGRPRSHRLVHLPETRAVDYSALDIGERRRVERIVPRAQPVWKLFTTGSVGGQALTGLPLISRLSRRPGVGVWPFQSPTDNIMLAEVYPSMIDAAVRRNSRAGSIKDELQVRLLARALFSLSQSGDLGRLFEDVPNWPGRADEGWILGAGHHTLLDEALA